MDNVIEVNRKKGFVKPTTLAISISPTSLKGFAICPGADECSLRRPWEFKGQETFRIFPAVLRASATPGSGKDKNIFTFPPTLHFPSAN